MHMNPHLRTPVTNGSRTDYCSARPTVLSCSVLSLVLEIYVIFEQRRSTGHALYPKKANSSSSSILKSILRFFGVPGDLLGDIFFLRLRTEAELGDRGAATATEVGVLLTGASSFFSSFISSSSSISMGLSECLDATAFFLEEAAVAFFLVAVGVASLPVTDGVDFLAAAAVGLRLDATVAVFFLVLPFCSSSSSYASSSSLPSDSA
mmetsp:Transcript_2135/g.4323  ORF Transcript_2135/g.4323 Transcript_2135/m.4323 type:complete len:207 (-) Transcript_2135:789-1409(-)